jgi:hypothetical protein
MNAQEKAKWARSPGSLGAKENCFLTRQQIHHINSAKHLMKFGVKKGKIHSSEGC